LRLPTPFPPPKDFFYLARLKQKAGHLILFKKANDLSSYIEKLKAQGKSIGFVPTMGALHAAHISLMVRAQQENDFVVCSIFVNPTQFNDPKDLEKYPRPVENDIAMLAEVKCDLLFLPEVNEVYPSGMNKLTDYDLGHLENFLEGASRPGHFKGVANVVDRFLQMVKPNRLYLGQKDFQQVKVLQRLLEVTHSPVKMVMCPILREESGLAMSSRNIRLTPEQRQNASGISKALFTIRDRSKEISPEQLQQEAIYKINQIPDAKVDYLEFCDADSFQIIHEWKDAANIVVVTAVNVGNVRLLDNVLL
jgi:pantoate--beta-alanine ligase